MNFVHQPLKSLFLLLTIQSPSLFRISILPANRAPQTQRELAPVLSHKRIAFQIHKHVARRRAPAVGKIPFPPPRAGSVHASASFLVRPSTCTPRLLFTFSYPAFDPCFAVPSAESAALPSFAIVFRTPLSKLIPLVLRIPATTTDDRRPPPLIALPKPAAHVAVLHRLWIRFFTRILLTPFSNRFARAG